VERTARDDRSIRPPPAMSRERSEHDAGGVGVGVARTRLRALRWAVVACVAVLAGCPNWASLDPRTRMDGVSPGLDSRGDSTVADSTARDLVALESGDATLDEPSADAIPDAFDVGFDALDASDAFDAVSGDGDTGGTDATSEVVPIESSPCAPCGPTEMCCGTRCIDVSRDPLNCGGCGTVCVAPRADTTCIAAACAVVACDPGYDNCDGMFANGCESDLATNANCGRCGNACSGATPLCAVIRSGDGGTTVTACSSGCSGSSPDRCGMTCTDVQADPANCGACARVCPAPARGAATCAAGTCGFTCDAGAHRCGTACADNNATA